MGLFGPLDTASHICQGEHDDDDDGDDDDDYDDDDDNLHKCHDGWDFLVHCSYICQGENNHEYEKSQIFNTKTFVTPLE